MDADEYHERYIGIVANNWTIEEYNLYSRLIRAHHALKICREDGSNSFVELWIANWSLSEEVCLAGEATSVESHPHDKD